MIYTSENKSINAIYTNDGQSIGIIYDNNGNIIWQKNSIMPIRFHALEDDIVEQYSFTLKNSELMTFYTGREDDNVAIFDHTNTAFWNYSVNLIKQDNSIKDASTTFAYIPINVWRHIAGTSSNSPFSATALNINGKIKSFGKTGNHTVTATMYLYQGSGAPDLGRADYVITKTVTTNSVGNFTIKFQTSSLGEEAEDLNSSTKIYAATLKLSFNGLLSQGIVYIATDEITEPRTIDSGYLINNKRLTFNNVDYKFSLYNRNIFYENHSQGGDWSQNFFSPFYMYYQNGIAQRWREESLQANDKFYYQKPQSLITINTNKIFNSLEYLNSIIFAAENSENNIYCTSPHCYGTCLKPNHYLIEGAFPGVNQVTSAAIRVESNLTSPTSILYDRTVDTAPSILTNGDYLLCASLHGKIPSGDWAFQFLTYLEDDENEENPVIVTVNPQQMQKYETITINNTQISKIRMRIINNSSSTIFFLNTTVDFDIIEGINPIYAKYQYIYNNGQSILELPSLPALTCRNGLNIFHARSKCSQGKLQVRIPRVRAILPSQNVINESRLNFTNLIYTENENVNNRTQVKGYGSTISNYRIYGKTQQTYQNFFNGTLIAGASQASGIANQLHSQPIAIERDKTYTISLNDYNLFNFKINTNLNNILPWTANKHSCGDPVNDNWQNQDITFTASQDGYLIINIIRENDLPITVEYAEQQELVVTVTNDVPIVAGVGDYDNVTNKYIIPLYVNEKSYKITLDTPLLEGEYIDYETQKRYNSDSTSLGISLPEVFLNLDDLNNNYIQVNSHIFPSKIEVDLVEREIFNSSYGKNLSE